ncbi:MAG TPA: hypothetical protein VG708_01800 [Mycobacteriales bacterium]|nr:hypothetical protein [Mycobacteriales bacterium]
MQVLLDVAAGRFLEPDGWFRVVPPYGDGLEAIVAFTGHAVVATALPTSDLASVGADGLGGAMHPAVQQLIAGPRGVIGVHDTTLVGRGLGGGRLPRRDDLADHPRVRHAMTIRTDVQVYGDDRGLVTLGRGLAGRCELSIELAPELQGGGHGSGLLRDGLGLLPDGEVVFAAVAPGNARSLRLFLRAGFRPIASEVIIRPGRLSTR